MDYGAIAGLVIGLIGAVIGLFFKSRAETATTLAEIARSAAGKLIEGIERGRNAENSMDGGSVKNIVKGLMAAAPPEVQMWFTDLKTGLVGGQ